LKERLALVIIYHLSTSRSERIIWLMEELGEPYELVKFQRENMRTPPAMKEIHPLGKSPLIRDGDLLIVESGAIVEYLVEKYGGGRLVPDKASDDYGRYLQWLHFSEGSLMPVLFQTLFASGAFGRTPSPDVETLRVNSDRYLDFVEGELTGPYFAGAEFTAADIMMAYALRWVDRITDIAKYPRIKAYIARIAERPVYVKSMAIANPPAPAPA
jgi:glutathione S-transferase